MAFEHLARCASRTHRKTLRPLRILLPDLRSWRIRRGYSHGLASWQLFASKNEAIRELLTERHARTAESETLRSTALIYQIMSDGSRNDISHLGADADSCTGRKETTCSFLAELRSAIGGPVDDAVLACMHKCYTMHIWTLRHGFNDMSESIELCNGAHPYRTLACTAPYMIRC